MSLDAIDEGLATLSLILSALVLIRLWREDLARIYKAFTALLFFDIAATLILKAIPYHTSGYGLTWMIFESVKLLLYMLVALGLYDLVLRPYPGILRAGRWALRISLGGATLVALLLLQLDLNRISGGAKNFLPYFFTVQRSVILTLAVFQLLALAFLVWFPLSLSRNARLYATLYILFFTGKSTALLAINWYGTKATRPFSILVLGLQCACLAAWALLLRRNGEDNDINARGPGKGADPGALTAKLKSINERLSNTDEKE